MSALAVVTMRLAWLLSSPLNLKVSISIPFSTTSIESGSTKNSFITSCLDCAEGQIIFCSLGATFFCILRKLCHLLVESLSFQLAAPSRAIL